MKWFTHKTVALAGALAAGAPAAGLIGVLVGSVLPDMADTALSGGNKRVWRRLHRQATHWFGWYLLLILGAVLLSASGWNGSGAGGMNGLSADVLRFLHNIARDLGLGSLSGLRDRAPAVQGMLGDLLFWIGLGGLTHVLLDALTPMGVPLYPLGGKRRIGIKLVSTGSFGETLFLICALGLIAAQFDEVRRLFSLALRQL